MIYNPNHSYRVGQSRLTTFVYSIDQGTIMATLKSLFAVVLTAFILLGTGCVAQSEYDNLQTIYRKTAEQVLELQLLLEEAEGRIAAFEAEGGHNQAMAMQLEAAIAERDRLRDALADAEARMRDLAAQPTGVVVLDPETDSALKELASTNPDLMTYDPEQGMVKLRSDLTFGLGSAEVNEQAKQSLAQLATVVNNGAASQYALRVVGHTDNVPIKNPATKAKHPSNWYLSVHRAIAVRDVLEEAGVAANRTYVAGYGEFMPVVANPARGGAEANRRVEIFLKPMPATAELADAAPAPAPEATPAPATGPTVVPAESQPEQPEMFK